MMKLWELTMERNAVIVQDLISEYPKISQGKSYSFSIDSVSAAPR